MIENLGKKLLANQKDKSESRVSLRVKRRFGQQQLQDESQSSISTDNQQTSVSQLLSDKSSYSISSSQLRLSQSDSQTDSDSSDSYSSQSSLQSISQILSPSFLSKSDHEYQFTLNNKRNNDQKNDLNRNPQTSKNKEIQKNESDLELELEEDDDTLIEEQEEKMKICQQKRQTFTNKYYAVVRQIQGPVHKKIKEIERKSKETINQPISNTKIINSSNQNNKYNNIEQIFTIMKSVPSLIQINLNKQINDQQIVPIIIHSDLSQQSQQQHYQLSHQQQSQQYFISIKNHKDEIMRLFNRVRKIYQGNSEDENIQQMFNEQKQVFANYEQQFKVLMNENESLGKELLNSNSITQNLNREDSSIKLKQLKEPIKSQSINNNTNSINSDALKPHPLRVKQTTFLIPDQDSSLEHQYSESSSQFTQYKTTDRMIITPISSFRNKSNIFSNSNNNDDIKNTNDDQCKYNNENQIQNNIDQDCRSDGQEENNKNEINSKYILEDFLE